MKKLLLLLFISGIVHAADEPVMPSQEDIFQNGVTNMALIETSIAFCSPTKEEIKKADALISWAKSSMSPVEQRRVDLLMEDRTVAVKSRVLSKGASVFCDNFGLAILSALPNGEKELFPYLGKTKQQIQAEQKSEKQPGASDKYIEEHGEKEFGIGIFDKKTKRESGS